FRRAYAEGHEIAGHNDHHEHMPETYSGKELTAEVAAVGAMIRRQTGHTIQLFRPPFGASSDEVLAEIGEQDMAEVLWNIDSQDWQGRPPDEIVMGVVDSAGPNAIVLLHDPLEQTMEAMPELIAQLRALDYEFVTVSEAIGGPIIGEAYPPGGLVGAPGRDTLKVRAPRSPSGPERPGLCRPPLFSRWWSRSAPPQDRPPAVRGHSGRARPHRRPRPRRCIPQHAPVGPGPCGSGGATTGHRESDRCSPAPGWHRRGYAPRRPRESRCHQPPQGSTRRRPGHAIGAGPEESAA